MEPEQKPSPWSILIVVLLASLAASLDQFKVPPLMPLLLKDFRASAGEGGLLMSAFALAGLFLAIPAGFILQKLGHCLTGALAMSLLIWGVSLGLSSQDMKMLLISRVFEGAGMSLIAVVAPALIGLYFSRERVGQAMGIWGVWVPLGSTIMFLLAPLPAGYGGYRAVWWFGLFYTGAVGLIFYLLIPSAPSPASGVNTSLLRTAILRNPELWLISLLFGCFNFAFTAFVTWTSTYLNQVREISITQADFLVRPN